MTDWQELEFNEILDWPRLPQLMALLLIFVFIQAVGYWLYLLPEKQHLQDLNQQEQVIHARLQVKANQVAALPQLQSQLDDLDQRYQLLLLQLPEQKELANLLASVNEIGVSNHLTFTRIDWGQKQPEHFLYRLPLNIELTGNFHDIGRFSQAIAALGRIVTFQNVTWQRVSQESETLHFRVTANTYQSKPEERTGAQ
ncbi:fimbrial protein [Vibrio azureus]|uniref:Type 4 pilus biogenesis protein PilO n=1 Tax=Vibrio azureus NBRC 104587 TaxID=1219077 RepID=U3AUR6_9VIBR|nr:type 4a pilus biogenesis protein PilO [Vibrio azureus]AUI87115.1 fimbrial protein [Vibrio azureus]GAD76992.1 type 4 pilus biogenesis protein PilO [Vibrio azureus NBRC 104587]